MEFLHKLIDLLFKNLGNDAAWSDMIKYVGGVPTLYAVLFAVVFCETGLVVLPFLPGDSLLFAVGAMAARNIGISVPVVCFSLIGAALLGDNVNYWIGRRLGPAVFSQEKSRFFNRDHLMRAHAFSEKYGPKTVIMARFVPIVRTFAPFVSGVAAMPYFTFLTFSVIGAVAWVSLCLLAGFGLGALPFFKKHFELVILAIVLVSLIPMAVELVKARREMKHAAAARGE